MLSDYQDFDTGTEMMHTGISTGRSDTGTKMMHIGILGIPTNVHQFSSSEMLQIGILGITTNMHQFSSCIRPVSLRSQPSPGAADVELELKRDSFTFPN